jgi:uncharacterized glyoxalase superfamily protein PhnB
MCSVIREQALGPSGGSLLNLTPFLLFDGNCAEAMQFYHLCFGGDLTLTRVADTPMKAQMPPEQHHKITYALLKSEAVEFSATDWLHPCTGASKATPRRCTSLEQISQSLCQSSKSSAKARTRNFSLSCGRCRLESMDASQTGMPWNGTSAVGRRRPDRVYLEVLTHGDLCTSGLMTS